jgi:predicted DNA-binding transcriptional regulator AlpA
MASENPASIEPADRLVTFHELKTITGIPYSRASLWRMERRGDFPQRIKLSPRRSAWRLSELRAWIDSRPRGMEHKPNAETGAGRKPKAALSDSART